MPWLMLGEWDVMRRCGPLLVSLVLAGCAGGETVVEKRVVISHALATTTQLFVERESGVKRAGSAVILDVDGRDGTATILTTAHLLEPPVAQSVSVIDETRRFHTPAEVVAVDAAADLALITAAVAAPAEVTLAPGAELADDVLVVAFPWGRERTVVNGAVSQISSDEPHAAPPPIWGAVRLIDASVSYGMSGGGVFHRRTGDLLGIVRGYRTAHLSLSSEPAPLKLPIAGETTVIPVVDIVCFLRANDHGDLVPRDYDGSASAEDCASQN